MSVDKSSLIGIVLAVGGIVAGLLLEGGNFRQIIQPTAAMIVFGGTIGAVMLQFPLAVVFGAAKGLVHVFFNRGGDPQKMIQELTGYANRARKEGMIALDSVVSS